MTNNPEAKLKIEGYEARFARLQNTLQQLEQPIVRTTNLLECQNDSMRGELPCHLISFLPLLQRLNGAEDEREKLRHWLSDVPFRPHHKRKRKECLAGSFQWLLGSPQYEDWKDSSFSSILWLRGTGTLYTISSEQRHVTNIEEQQSRNGEEFLSVRRDTMKFLDL